MRRKKIVVIYNENDWNVKVPLSSLHTRKAFEDWHNRGIKKGIEFYRASIEWLDPKSATFSKGWAFREGQWIRVSKPIKPDLIFDKLAGREDFMFFDLKMDLTKKVKVYNHPLFRTICDNKLGQYLILKEFMAPSWLANDEDELKSALRKIKSRKAVIKPLYGSGGFGILITEKEKIFQNKIPFPVVAQEFIQSSKGIPGFTKGKAIADLRMIFMNHKLIYALSRVAKKGSLFTNFHQGATAILVPIKKIPKSAVKMANQIIKKLAVFPKANYSLDFMFNDQGKPVLVEMNTTPGFDLLNIVGDEKIKEKNFLEFIKNLE